MAAKRPDNSNSNAGPLGVLLAGVFYAIMQKPDWVRYVLLAAFSGGIAGNVGLHTKAPDRYTGAEARNRNTAVDVFLAEQSAKINDLDERVDSLKAYEYITRMHIERADAVGGGYERIRDCEQDIASLRQALKDHKEWTKRLEDRCEACTITRQ